MSGVKQEVNNAGDYVIECCGAYYAYEHDDKDRLLGAFDCLGEAVDRIGEACAGICLKDDGEIVFAAQI